MANQDIVPIVEEAASKINLCPDKRNHIRDRLQEEYITQSWQLESVSNEQWRSMGAPIGFVISLQTCLSSPMQDSPPPRRVEKRRSRRHSTREPPPQKAERLSRRHASREPKEKRDSCPRKSRKSGSVQPSKRYFAQRESPPQRDYPPRDSPSRDSPSSRQEYHDPQKSNVPRSPASPSSSTVKRNPETGRLCYVSRGKIIYEWEESFDSVVLFVPKPKDIDMSDVICNIGENSLKIGSKGEKKSFFSRPTGGVVIPGKSTWVPYGGIDVKGIIVTLAKANQGSEWKRPLLPPNEGSQSSRNTMNSLSQYLENYHTDTESVVPVLETHGKKSPSVESLERKEARRKKMAADASVDRSKNHSLASQETQPVHNGARQSSRRSSPTLVADDDSLWTIKNTSPESNDREEALDDHSLTSRWSRRARKGANRKFWTPRTKKQSKEPGTLSSHQKQAVGYRTSFSGSIDPIDLIIPSVPFIKESYDAEDEEMHSVQTEITDPMTPSPGGRRPIISLASSLAAAAPLLFDDDHSLSTISTMGSRNTIRTILSMPLSRRAVAAADIADAELVVDEETYDLARRSSKSMDEFNMMVHHYSRPQDELNNSLRTFARSLSGSLADIE